tara:strand:- start:119 stop:280 length:162 start_codon:yes stop_codon:yes gene_type:complete
MIDINENETLLIHQNFFSGVLHLFNEIKLKKEVYFSRVLDKIFLIEMAVYTNI